MGEERYEELQELTRIQEKLVGHGKTVDVSTTMQAVSVNTRTTTRRLRFANQFSNGRSTERNEELCENQEYEKCTGHAVTQLNPETRNYQMRRTLTQ